MWCFCAGCAQDIFVLISLWHRRQFHFANNLALSPSRIFLFIYNNFVKRIISRWDLSASQWPLQCYLYCVCALVAYDWLKRAVALHSACLTAYRSGYSGVWLLHGWCDEKLLLFCVHHTNMHQFAVPLYSKPDKCVFNCKNATCTFGRMTGTFYVLLR